MCAEALYLWICSQAHSTSFFFFFYQWKGLCMKSKQCMDLVISLTEKLHPLPLRQVHWAFGVGEKRVCWCRPWFTADSLNFLSLLVA